MCSLLLFSLLTSVDIGSDSIHAQDKKTEAKITNCMDDALQWIATHQLENGSWNFDHRIGPGRHRTSPNPGLITEAENAATSLAILPFLAAGQTHQKGKHKETIGKGLKFLISNMKEEKHGGSFHERRGMMYSHGMTAIVLCEVYGQSGDMNLVKPAQLAIDYIVYAQDPVGGGWRYLPRQAGDSSISGWQILALKTAKLAGLTVPKKTLSGASKFLDSVATAEGAFYGYTAPAKSDTCTAIGLLSRIELEWSNRKALKEGITHLGNKGPSVKNANMYHNYFATEALFAYHQTQHEKNDRTWSRWQAELAAFLLKEQASKGSAKGSWFFGHGYAKGGGRLYDTALAALTLQIYQRQLVRLKARDD